MIRRTVVLFLLFAIWGCNPEPIICNLYSAENQFEKLPEEFAVFSIDSIYKAEYILPTSRYTHGVLGDAIEAGGLLLTNCDTSYSFRLDENLVFEDLSPRLFDVDNDGVPEIITILTNVELGASVAVFEINESCLRLLAQSNYIGRSKRWLNIAAIDDLDEDGAVELAWITTPHIGGTLKVGRIIGGRIEVVDSIDGVSNHEIGSRNLDLSVIVTSATGKLLYVPNNEFTKVIGFSFQRNKIVPEDTIGIAVDPMVTLNGQLVDFL